MLLKLVLFISCISLAASISVSGDNERHIIELNDGTTLYEIYEVMDTLQLHEGKEREAMKMDYINYLLPVVFANMSKETARKVEQLEAVKHVEVDQLMYMQPIVKFDVSMWLDIEPPKSNPGEPKNPPKPNLGESTDRYNLDIMNKPVDGCRNDQYNLPNDGTGADIYILDTGINYDHNDFKDADGETRAKYGGHDAITPPNNGEDCQGHGSHCAGIAAGLQSGVAKNANLYSIRVLGCTGSGSTSGIITALDFLGSKHDENKVKTGFVASIASMSLGGWYSTSLNNAVNELVGKGVIVVTASGNDGGDACLSSPSSAGDNINVGAHSEPSNSGQCLKPIESFSNWGTCVDVIAPGRDIMSVKYDSNVDFTTMSGTSMACPHVAGAAALIMKNDNSLTPAEVKQKIKDLSTDDIDRSAQSAAVRAASDSKRLYVPTSL